MRRELVWTAESWRGIEYTSLDVTGDRAIADGAIIAVVGGRPIRLRYRVECESAWRPASVTVDVHGRPAVSLRREGDGWYDLDGRERPDLAGCLDVDIALTPLTNTIPIRRLALDVGESKDIDVVYIDPSSSLEVRPQRQQYTRTGDGYRYSSGSFEADLLVDEDGIVVDYPGLWTLASP